MAQKSLMREKSTSLGSVRRWLMLAVILIATFMAALDTFIVNVAAPSLSVNIRVTFAEIQLIVAGYTLGYAVLLVTGGRLGDLYGRKLMFLLGVLGFTLSSICCGYAQTTVMLICFLVVQGILAALMTPQVMALIQTNFSAEERGIAFSAFSITIGLASILGQVVGGEWSQLCSGGRSLFSGHRCCQYEPFIGCLIVPSNRLN